MLRRLSWRTQPAFGWPSVINAAELANVVAWPVGNPAIPGVAYTGQRQLPPSSEALVRRASPRHRITGQATFPGIDGLLVLPPTAALQHTYILGPTGVGKSTLVASLALQDIAAHRAVVVIDPSVKGDLIRDIVDRIPAERRDDVVLLDPNDPAPVGLNVLAGSSPELAVDAVVHVLHELHAAHWGPRTADILHHGLLALARHADMTLLELPPLLGDRAFRERIVDRLGADPLGVGPFFAWFNALSDTERSTVTGPLLNKLRQFTQRPAIRGIIGQVQGIDLQGLLAKQQVLLVTLAPHAIGSEAAQLLGALLVGQLWTAVQARGGIAPERRRPAFVYLDEFQNILRLPLDIGDALAQARGLGVGLILSHQHISQLPPTIRGAVLANARSKIAFGLDHDDALIMAKHLGGGLTPTDLQNLGRYETYQQLLTKSGSALASGVTRPLSASLGSADDVHRRSRAQWGQDRAAVDAAVLARRATTALPSTSHPIGSRRRGARS